VSCEYCWVFTIITMKLLSKSETNAGLKKEREALIENIEFLRKKVIFKSQPISNQEIQEQKSELLKELKDIEEVIVTKREVIQGMMERQDELDERVYQIDEREKKVELRENFIKVIEQKQYGVPA